MCIRDRSYGIEVAKLAGLPDSVLTIARQRLASFERANLQPHQDDLFAAVPSVPEPTTDPVIEEVVGVLRNANPNDMTPIQALAMIETLKSALKANTSE